MSRLEEDGSVPCTSLRRTIASSTFTILQYCILAHEDLVTHSSPDNLQQYHDLYEITNDDLNRFLASGCGSSMEAISIRDLRQALKMSKLARQTVACALLAVPAESTDPVKTWTAISRSVEDLVQSYGRCVQPLLAEFDRQNTKQWTTEQDQRDPRTLSEDDGVPGAPSTPISTFRSVQQQRLNKVSNGIRALNARIQLLREEFQELALSSEEPANLNNLLTHQYEVIGIDLKSLIAEWEQGKRAMLLGAANANRQSSRSSNGLRLPLSPASSLGGRTMVEGSPAEALRLLSGDEMPRPPPDMNHSDDEVYEAVSRPCQRMSMTREEKIARMQEDRRKRQTFHEQLHMNTNMLRELEMVIKHRPRGRSASSRILSV